MNALEKILSPVISAINGIFEKINPRTSDMIRQSYILIIVVIGIGGAILGASSGKHAAKKTGVQMAETTNQIFDLDIKQAKAEGGFGSLIESESENSPAAKDIIKEAAPAREHAVGDDSATILEPERDRHIKTTPDAVERRELPAIPRLDESDPFIDNDVKRAEPKRAEKGRADVRGMEERPVITQKNTQPEAAKENTAKKSGDDIRGPVKAKTAKTKLKAMEKKESVAE
jgi:hypothetical protein